MYVVCNVVGQVNIVQELPRQLVTHENFIKYELIATQLHLPSKLSKVLNVHEIFAPAHHIIFMEHIFTVEKLLYDI